MIHGELNTSQGVGGSPCPAIHLSDLGKAVHDTTLKLSFQKVQNTVSNPNVYLYTYVDCQQVMSAGCIPVFVTRDYVKPFTEEVDWSEFSFTFSPDEVPDMIRVLRSVPPGKLKEMQVRGRAVDSCNLTVVLFVSGCLTVAVRGFQIYFALLSEHSYTQRAKECLVLQRNDTVFEDASQS